MRHVMLDIETLGRKPGCVVLSVGAVEFDAAGANGTFFECNISIKSSMDYGLTIEAETLEWWMDQGIRRLPRQLDLPYVASLFADWFKDNNLGDALLWANSPSFDCEIWGNAMEAVDVARPWKYWNLRDVRTARHMLPEFMDMPDNEKKHDALADAKWQAEYLRLAGLFSQGTS